MLFGAPPLATNASAPPMIAETWACSYKEGQGIDDLLKVRDFMVAEASKNGLTLPPSFLWTLSKGDAPIDYLWFNVHQDISAYGAAADAFQASGIGPAVSRQFSALCDSAAGMGQAHLIFQQGDIPSEPIFIVAAGCNYINGAGPERLAGLITNMRDVLAEMGDNAPAFSTAIESFTLPALASQDPLSQDVFLYSGFENASSWSNYIRALSTTKAGQRLRDSMDEMLQSGGLTIWSGQQV